MSGLWPVTPGHAPMMLSRALAFIVMGPLFEEQRVRGRNRVPHRAGARACFPAYLGGFEPKFVRVW